MEISTLLAQLDSTTLDIATSNVLLAQISRSILPPTLTLRLVAVDELIEQDLNAQSMSKAMFDQLIANMKDAQAAESSVLAVQTAKGLELISGHHRTRAARAAGIRYVLAYVYTELSRARVHSKQLAHNSISGTSDPELVRRIWERIDDVQARFEAFIDPKLFDSIPPPVSFKPIDVDLVNSAKSILVTFLPTQQMDFDAALERILPKAEVDAVYIAHRDHYDQWLAALKRVRSELEIVNVPTALVEMARLAVERLDQLAAEQAEDE
jgi:hypothetical protein